MSQLNRRILIGLGLVVVLDILFFGSLAALTKISGVSDPYTSLNLSTLVFLIVETAIASLLIVYLGIIKFGKVSLQELGWKTDNIGSDISIGIGGGLLAAAGIFVYGFILNEWTFPELWALQMEYSFVQRMLFLLIGLSAGFIEESLFRGYLQPALIEKFDLAIGVCATAFLFAIYHLQFMPLAMGGRVLLGLIFGLLRSKDQSMFRPGIAHALVWFVVGAA